MLRILLLALFSASVVAPQSGLAQAVPDKKPDAKPIVVPFVLLPSRHMLIEVTINDKGPYKLIFDTGAPLNLLNSRIGKDTGLSKKGGSFGIFSGGLNQVEIKSMTLGAATAEKLPAVVMDHPTVKAISEMFEDDHGKIEGIVGFPFFARFTCTVDYQKKQLTLIPNGYKPGDYIQDLTTNLTKASEAAGKPKVLTGLGIWGFTTTKDKDDEESGVTVGKVFEGSAAAAAGLKPDDRILTIDGRWTDTVGDAYLAASLVKPGRAVEIDIKRDGKAMTLKIAPRVGF